MLAISCLKKKNKLSGVLTMEYHAADTIVIFVVFSHVNSSHFLYVYTSCCRLVTSSCFPRPRFQFWRDIWGRRCHWTYDTSASDALSYLYLRLEMLVRIQSAFGRLKEQPMCSFRLETLYTFDTVTEAAQAWGDGTRHWNSVSMFMLNQCKDTLPLDLLCNINCLSKMARP